MNRLKLLATATLMALTLNACDEGTPPIVEPPPDPPAVGTISGTVTIEGTAASGVTATLSSGATTTTGSGGSFAFSGVEEGTYTVTISGFPEDATFAQVTQSATIATDGQNVQLNFAGEYIRSSAVVGSVVAADAMMSGGDGQPETLGGVTVTLDGEHAMGETMETDANGGFAFTGLRAGTYTVTISDFPEDVSFETVSVEVQVDVGEVGQADFTGHFIRTSAVEGQVVIEGEGLAGITVTLSGGPADESFTMMTDANGMYRFDELRPGDYTVSISDFDTRDYEFAATSQDVSVDLDETGTVSFTGVLLRTSGISGRVSVEGMGLGGIEVTLAGAADRTATTDAGGQYAFAGLAAGDYTVSIAVADDAYVFDAMSADVALADDESAIVNFEGAHARTASVSGMAFLDELDKNDEYDAGEDPLAHAGIPVVLVGPGVNDQQLGATDANGEFSFAGLRAGAYQLVVPIDATDAAALAAADVAYGGSAAGFSISVGVGEATTQNVPFDITHTTVNFTVSLRHGDATGAALPGATVTLSSGDNTVGSGETGEDGSVAIRVARAGTSGDMVMASVSADGYDVADGMTEVSWDPQMFATSGANENDIVNLNVDATVSGATVTTDYGGGDALAGWAISVMSGEEAVEGAPEMLGEEDADDEGMAAFTTTVGADDLPATFTFAVAEDQDDKLDGGESYAAEPVEYEHTGLSLAGTMDAGTIEVAYTTQTLKVYVHHEKDQVMGYTGNILGGDQRMSGMVELTIRHIDDAGRSRSFSRAMWDAADNSTDDKSGGYTFAHLPADANVIVQADEAADGIKLLDPDELAAFRNMEDNGVSGGAFGAMGGFSHTVELCPLQATEPTGQDHGDCASFAYVTTHTVSGEVWKKSVAMDGDDFKVNDEDHEAGISVDLSPVEGKNLAGDEESYTTAEKDDDDTPLDETHEFSFGGVAAGVYSVSVSSGWQASADDAALSPLDDDLSFDVTPTTTVVYGRVTDGDGFSKGDVTVDVNGLSATTDDFGRYIVDGVSPQTRKIGNTTHRNSIFVETSHEGSVATRNIVDFAANSPTHVDVGLSGVGAIATISGTVRASGTNAPIAGVEIRVDGEAPNNAATSGANKGKLVTDSDGTYTAEIDAKGLGESAQVSASKTGMTFVPATLTAPAHAGAEISGVDFTGYVNASIRGRVVAPGGGPMSGVEVTATPVGDSVAVAIDTTGTTGTYALSVSWGGFTIAASAEDHTFDYPATGQVVNVAPGQVATFGDIQARTFAASGLAAERDTDDDGNYDGTITVSWTAGTVPEGHIVNYQAQTKVGDAGWTDFGSDVASDADPQGQTGNAPADSDGGFMVRVVATSDNGTPSDNSDDRTIESDPVTVAAIDPSASNVAAVRALGGGTDPDTLQVTWDATTSANSDFRVVLQVDAGGIGPQWYARDATGADRSWSLEITDGFSETWTTLSGVDVTVTEADLDGKLSVAVESVQGTVTDDNPWTRSAVVSVDAKPDDG